MSWLLTTIQHFKTWQRGDEVVIVYSPREVTTTTRVTKRGHPARTVAMTKPNWEDPVQADLEQLGGRSSKS